MSSIIDLKNITKTYLTGNTICRALKSINLSINENELIAVMGESGSGKSTLINIIGLLDQPTSGSFLLDGKEAATLDRNTLATLRNQKIGFVFQSFFLLPRLSAEQNIALPLLYRGLSIEEANEKAFKMLEKINISHLAKNRPNQMSGGQQQRVAIARALVGNPEVILADEPTGALDSTIGQEIVNLFIKLHREEKRTIIIVTHNEHISKQCERIICLKDGEIISDERN